MSNPTYPNPSTNPQHPDNSTPVERKVKAATAGGTITGVVIWALMTYVPAFAEGVPEAVNNLVVWAVPVAVAALSGYFAKHTPRSGLDPKNVEAPPNPPPTP